MKIHFFSLRGKTVSHFSSRIFRDRDSCQCLIHPSIPITDSFECSKLLAPTGALMVLYIRSSGRPDQTRPDQTRPDLKILLFCVASTVLRLRCYIHLKWYYSLSLTPFSHRGKGQICYNIKNILLGYQCKDQNWTLKFKLHILKELLELVSKHPKGCSKPT